MRPAITAPTSRREVPAGVVLTVLIAISVVTAMDLPMVGVALPYLPVSDRPFGLFDVIWTLIAVSLPIAVLLTPEVLRAEGRGRRRLVLRGLLAYAVGAAVAAASPSLAAVVLARVVQGGCVLAIAGALAICADVPTRDERTRRIALWGAGTAIGFSVGPFAGALMLGLGSWRLIFILQCTLGVALFIAARAALVESRAAERPAIPKVGLRLAGILALALFFWGVDGALQGGVDTVDAGFMIAGLGGGAAWLWALRRRPRVPRAADPEAFRANRVTTAIGLAIGAGIGASTLADAFYLGSILKMSPLGVGLGVLPILIGALPVGLILRITGAQRGHRAMLVIGGAAWVLGLIVIMVTLPGVETGTGRGPWVTWLPALVLQGAGVGLVLTALGQLAVNRARRREWLAAEVASGLAARSTGTTIGFFALVALATGQLPTDPIVPLRSWAFAAVAGLVVIALVIAVGRELRLPEQLASERPMDLSHMARASLPVMEAQPTAATELDPLRDLPLFAGLTNAQVDTLRRTSNTVLLPAGQELFMIGDRTTSVYIVQSGRLVTRVDGVVTAVHVRGDLIGEADLLRGRPRSSTAAAVRDSSLMEIPTAAFTEAADEGVYRRLAAQLADRIAALEPLVRDERPASARDAVVAVIGLQPGLPIDDVRDAIAGRIAKWRSVVALGVVDRLALEHAEQHAQHVLLAAGPTDEEWRDFCLRSADRIVLVSGEPGPATREWADVLVGADLLVIDAVPTNAQWAAWERALRPDFSRATTIAHLEEDARPIADRIAGRSIGLALGGGGAKGLAHLGVIEVLTEAGLTFDRIAGTSMGAVVGSLYAAGLSPEEMDALAYELLVRNHPMGDFTVPRHSILRGRRIDVAYRELFGDLLIEALPRTFRCVSVDLVTRAAVVHRNGPVADAVAASSRLPGILPVYPHPHGGLHVDGAMLNNLPVSVLTGPDGPVIAVEVGGHNELAKRVASGAEVEPLSLAETIFRSLMMASDDANEAAIASAAVHIRPDTSGATLTEFHRLDVMREAGRAAALDALPEIARLLSQRS